MMGFTKISETPQVDFGIGFMPSVLPLEGFLAYPSKADDDPIAGFITQMAAERQMPSDLKSYMRQNPLDAFQAMIDRLNLVFVMIRGGEISVYSRNTRTELPGEALARLEELTGMLDDTPCGWFRSVEGDPVETTTGVALYGYTPAKVRRTTDPKKKKTELRRKFWGTGGYDPKTAADVVDKLLS